ncbi:MAG: sauU 6 [Firmicutes bacterium]|nr:sauU 6 [Bacillota bacterium]
MSNEHSKRPLPDPEKHKISYARHRLAVILFVVLFVAYIDRVNISVLVVDPVFLDAMGIANDPVAKGSLMTIFLVFFGLGNVLLSPLGDWLGPKKSTLIAIFLWGLAMMIGGLAATLTMMVMSRVLLGIGEGIYYPMQSKFVKNWFPVHERGKANATWLVGVNVAPMFAMPLFAWMIPEFGWKNNFYFLSMLSVIPFVLVWMYTSDNPHQFKNISKKELEYIEGELAKEQAEEYKSNRGGIWESYIGVLKNTKVWMLVLAYSGTSSIWWGIVTWLPAYLRDARGFSWAEMGMWASLPYILAVVVKLFAGWAVDKFNKPSLLLGIALLGSAIFIYFGAYAQSSVNAVLLISFGVGMLAIGTPSAWYMLQKVLPSNAVASGAGMMSGVSSGISAAAPVMTGVLIGLTGSYIGGLMYMVGWGVFGAFICFVLGLSTRK